MADRPIALSQFIAESIDAFVGKVQPETAEERRARLERKWLRRRRQHEETFGIPPRRAQAAGSSDDTPGSQKTPSHLALSAEDVAARVVERLREQASLPTSPTPTAVPAQPRAVRDRARLALRAKQAIDEAGAIVDSLAGAEANPPPKARAGVRRPRQPTTCPNEIDLARAKKIMRERGMIK